jgi:hypothetical protein
VYSTPVALHPLAYSAAGLALASQCAWLSKQANSLPCGSAPCGTCSATHAHELLAGGVASMPNASAMPEPHHVRSSAQGVPPAAHGFSGSASHDAASA